MKSFQEEWKKIKDYYQSESYQREIIDSKKILLDTPFVLYGAGVEGVEFANILEYGGCSPICFCDKVKTGIEKNTNLEIIKPSDLLSGYKGANIVISSAFYCEEIESELLELGISKERILPRRILLLLLLHLCESDNIKNIENQKMFVKSQYLTLFNVLNTMISDENGIQFVGCENTYEWLADDRSKEVFLDYLKLCFIAQSPSPDSAVLQYFDSVMALTDKEVFVDCGTYIGDTAKIFMENVYGKYEHYYAFEPDKVNYQKAAQFFKDKENVTMVPQGLWSRETTLQFKEGCACGSTIEDEGEGTVSVTSIDKYFSGREFQPTIIKMDIEGSELEALKGAEQMLRTHKPKLAICIYHKPEDLYEIPAFIKSCRDDYKFYIRHYTNTFAELVLYAI